MCMCMCMCMHMCMNAHVHEKLHTGDMHNMCMCMKKCHSTQGRERVKLSQEPPHTLIRTVIMRCELAALLTVQQVARVFLCVYSIPHKLGRLAGRSSQVFFHLAPTPKVIP